MRLKYSICFIDITLFILRPMNINSQDMDQNYIDCGKNIKTGQETRFIFKYPNARNQPGIWPWLVSIGQQSAIHLGAHHCGGSLVTQDHVLTAAHCPQQLWREIAQGRIFIRAGDSHLQDTIDDGGVQIVQVVNFTVHQDYTGENRYADVGVLKILKPVKLTELVRLICLPSRPTLRYHEDNIHLVVTGWGANVGLEAGKALQDTNIQVYPEEYCNLTHIGEYRNSVTVPDGFTSDLFCGGDIAGSEGVCEGDSGSPAVLFKPLEKRFVLKGIVSGGLSCGTRNYPNIFVRVSDLKIFNWIHSQISDEPLKKEGERCGSRCGYGYCPRNFWAGECESGLVCTHNEKLGDSNGFCRKYLKEEEEDLFDYDEQFEDIYEYDEKFDRDEKVSFEPKQAETKNVCVTTPSKPNLKGNLSKGETACAFPFLYKGEEYKTCAYGNVTRSLPKESLWCSTKVDKYGKHVRGEGEWGFCSQTCSFLKPVKLVFPE